MLPAELSVISVIDVSTAFSKFVILDGSSGNSIEPSSIFFKTVVFKLLTSEFTSLNAFSLFSLTDPEAVVEDNDLTTALTSDFLT